MSPSDACLSLIKRFEGCELKAYICPAGILTVGYGHTGPEVHVGLMIDQRTADAYLLKDATHAGDAINEMVKVPLSQSQFDALVSFVFNVGAKAFQKSTMLRKLNAGDYLGAAMEFPKWRNGGGRVLDGLVARRAAEQAMFQLG